MPRTIDAMVMHTLAGDKIFSLGKQERGYSSLGGTTYAEKPLADFTGGELILWEKQFINKSLAELEPHLRERPRYAAAEQGLFYTNPDGNRTPRFRIELLKALLAECPAVTGSSEDLEARLTLENGMGFTPKEYSVLANELYARLESVGKANGQRTDDGRKLDTVRSWLMGEVLAPESYEMFKMLWQATGNETFKEWHSLANENTALSEGFWRDYRFYVGMRQETRSYFSRGRNAVRRGAQETGQQGNKHESGLDIAAEVRHVLRQLIGELDEDYSPVRVIGVERIRIPVEPSQGGSKPKGEENPKLIRGPYIGKPREKMAVSSLADVVNNRNFFGYVCGVVVDDFLSGTAEGRYAATPRGTQLAKLFNTATGGNAYLKELLGGEILLRALQKLGLGREGVAAEAGRLRHLPKQEQQGMKNLVDEVSVYLADATLTGAIDKAMGTGHSSMYSLLEKYSLLSAALPKLYNEWADLVQAANILTKEIPRSQRRETQRRLENTEAKLKATYNFIPDTHQRGFLMGDMTRMVWEEAYKNSSRMLASGVLKGSDDFIDYVLEVSAASINKLKEPNNMKSNPVAARLWESYKATYFTAAQTKDMLAKSGLLPLFPLIPKANFAFEEGAKETPFQEAKNA